MDNFIDLIVFDNKPVKTGDIKSGLPKNPILRCLAASADLSTSALQLAHVINKNKPTPPPRQAHAQATRTRAAPRNWILGDPHKN